MPYYRRYTGLALAIISIQVEKVVSTTPTLTLSFTSEARLGTELPLNESSFVFNGSTSDIARQLYLRHQAGDRIAQVVPNSIPAAVTARLLLLNVSFKNLPGLLQRALLWDSGYVISPVNDAVQIWTLGGRPMAHLAVSEVEFHTTGCTALNCSQPDGTMYYANEFCTGTQMLTTAKCLMDTFESDSSSHLAMWSDGGDMKMVPEIRAVMHGWLDASTNSSYLLAAVHTAKLESEPAYGACKKDGYGSLVVPCYSLKHTAADIVAVMAVPVETPWITTWIKQYQVTSDTSVSSEGSSNFGAFHPWLLIPIIIAVIVAAGLIFFVVSRKRRHLRSVYWQHDSFRESEVAELGRKTKRTVPLAMPYQHGTGQRRGRTEQSVVNEQVPTLCSPEDNDCPVEEAVPMGGEVVSRPRRYTAPTSRIASVVEEELPEVLTDVRSTRSSTMSTAQSPVSRASSRASACIATPERSHSARGVSPHVSRSGNTRSEVRSTRSSTYCYAPTGREYLPQLRESASMPPIRESVSTIRDSIQADRALIPAMRETFCRYSAADNVQYTLTTDPNLIGKRIAWERIELDRLLSSGAFGEVWLCRYASKQVAVKRLLQSKKPTFRETEAFTSEIQLTASLDHPNIVRFIGVCWSSLENLAMVEEYLSRGDLQNYLQQNSDLMTWACDKIDMAIGVARAIACLHGRRVIHRDIKARNVLLTKRLRPKLIDFGASRLWAPSDMSAGVGTPFWTAPEVLESTEYTEKADIYSFGVLLSELDTGKAPYHNMLRANGEKAKPFLILKKVVDGSLRPSLVMGCPQRIRKAAEACFQHDPKLRPSAAELVKLLDG
uniref:Protein kinase domain-containing protein n=1 Tax=Hyaloperonospora arabidopsidis (strain Emoy2) TaxID=559515 RepID=M4C5R4_HYAAE